MNNRKEIVVGILGVGWVFSLTIFYFSNHKPFSPETFSRIIFSFWQLLSAVWIVSVAGGVGLYLIPAQVLPPLTSQALQALLGLGILALGVLLAGITTGISVPGFVVALIFLSIIFSRSIWQWWRPGLVWRSLWHHFDQTSRWMVIITGTVMLCSLSISLAPPIQYDALVYHLVLPETYLRVGRVVHLPWNEFSGMPQIIEMLYTWAMAVGGRSAAAVLGWLISALVLSGMIGSGFGLDNRPHDDGKKKKFPASVRLVCSSTAILVSGYTLAASTGWAYVDWGALAFGWGCLMCLTAWHLSSRKGFIALAGVFAGLAVGTKYTAGVIIFCGFGIIAWRAWIGKKDTLLPVMIFGGLALTISLPWWIKNYYFTGNPFHPFFFNIGSQANDVGTRIYQSNPPWGTWQDVLLLPFRATIMGAEGGSGYGASIGPLLLGLGIFFPWRLLSLPRNDRLLVENSFIMALVGIFTWIVANQCSGYLIQTRFYFPIFSAFSLLAGAGYASLSLIEHPKIRLGRLVSALVFLVLILNLFEIFRQTFVRNSLGYILGVKSESQYIVDNLGQDYKIVMEKISDLPDGSKTLLLFEPRSLYCQPKCSPDDHLDQWKQLIKHSHREDQLLQFLRDKGYSHLLVNKSGVDFMRMSGDPHYTSPEWVLFENFQAYLSHETSLSRFGKAYEWYNLSIKPEQP